jgi:putative membrane protein
MLNACSTHPRPAVDAESLSADGLPEKHLDTMEDPLDTAFNTVTKFALAAWAGNRTAMVLGKFAQLNAKSPRVKKYGERMVMERTQLNKILMGLAEIHHIRLPSAIPARIQSQIDEIRKLKGQEFDRNYLLLMADHHQKDIDLFEYTARHLRDTTFKAFIIKKIPLLRVQLDSAKAIKNEL